MARQLEVTKEQQGNVFVFSVRGPVDAATLELFDHALGPIFRSRNAKAVVDCSEMTYICSHAMGLLVEYHRQCCLGSGRIVVCAPSPSILKAFERLRLDAILKIAASREEALAALV
jgi:anti-sigma B factor antagonist